MKDDTEIEEKVKRYSKKSNRASSESKLMNSIKRNRHWLVRGAALFGILSLPFFAWSTWLWAQQILADGLSQSESLEIAAVFGMVAFCCWVLAASAYDDDSDDSFESFFE